MLDNQLFTPIKKKEVLFKFSHSGDNETRGFVTKVETASGSPQLVLSFVK